MNKNKADKPGAGAAPVPPAPGFSLELSVDMAVFFDTKTTNKASTRAAMLKDKCVCKSGRWWFPSLECMQRYLPGVVKSRGLVEFEPVEGPQQPQQPVETIEEVLAVAERGALAMAEDALAADWVSQPEVRPEATSASEELKAAIEGSRRRLVLEPSGWWFIATSVPSKGWIPTKKRKSLERNVEYKPMNGTTASITTETSQRTIVAPDEYKRCQSTVGRLANRLRTMGKPIATNIVAVPLSRVEEFKATNRKCQQILQAFNKETEYHEIELIVYEMVIATSSEAQMAADVTKEINRLLADMRAALDSCDVASIKAVAAKAEYKAKTLAASSAQAALSGAVAAAKKAMSTMKKEIVKKGTSVEETKRKLAEQFKAVDSARMTFLEFDVGEVEIDAESAAEAQKFLTIELGAEDEIVIKDSQPAALVEGSTEPKSS